MLGMPVLHQSYIRSPLTGLPGYSRQHPCGGGVAPGECTGLCTATCLKGSGRASSASLRIVTCNGTRNIYRRLLASIQGIDEFLINSFVDKQLDECWRLDRCENYRVGLRRRVLMKLDILDMATCLEDVVNTPGCQVEPLRSGQRNLYTLVVDEPWRLVFRYENGGFYDVWLKQFK